MENSGHAGSQICGASFFFFSFFLYFLNFLQRTEFPCEPERTLPGEEAAEGTRGRRRVRVPAASPGHSALALPPTWSAAPSPRGAGSPSAGLPGSASF